MSASARLTSWFVSRSSRSASGASSAVWTCLASSVLPARISSSTRVAMPMKCEYSSVRFDAFFHETALLDLLHDLVADPNAVQAGFAHELGQRPNHGVKPI